MAFKMAGMAFKEESPARKNKVGKFIKSRINRVKTNVKGVVGRVKKIGSSSSSNDNNDTGDDTIKVAGNNTKVDSSIEDTLPKTPIAKKAPTRKYKKKK